MPAEDWKKKIDDARAKARAEADKAGDPDLDQLNKDVAELRGIFDDLKLTDKETYDKLIAIVEEATRKHERLASVIKNIKALGDAGKALVTKVAKAGSIGALRTALRLG